MKAHRAWLAVCCLAAGGIAGGIAAQGVAWGNGGPFVVKYPSGDPAAKGILARLDPDLKPARETRLRVVEENLGIAFEAGREARLDGGTTPLAQVTAAYRIENPTAEEVTVDFGFPILRGIYMSPYSMMPTPAVGVTVDGTAAKADIISNSVIYAIIRARSRQTIDRGIAADPRLAALVKAVPKIPAAMVPPSQPGAAPAKAPAVKEIPGSAERAALHQYLTEGLKWNAREAQLLVEYASADLGAAAFYPMDRWAWDRDAEMRKLVTENLGALAPIGEQKATQLFACLAARFDPKAAGTYEAIFAAWGGDVRERSVDIESGKVRPRELEIAQPSGGAPSPLGRMGPGAGDPAVFARVDYLDQVANLSPAQKESLRNVLKDLPVVFTFAPMNFLHYEVEFPAKATREVVVSYRQYAYLDTRDPQTYQLSYVVHPASLWDSFGPIHLTVTAPEGVRVAASVPLAERTGKGLPQSQGPTQAAVQIRKGALANAAAGPIAAPTTPGHVYQATLRDAESKTGEWFFAVDKAAWDRAAQPRTAGPPTAPVMKQMGRATAVVPVK